MPKPQYNLWQALSAALALAMQAIDEVRALAREPGPKGDKGDPGPVGMGFDDFDISHDGERTVTFRWSRGSHIEERKFIIPSVIYRGVFKQDASYVCGDCVTWDGCTWHCNEPTVERPGQSKAWTMQTKKGRDGKDGQMQPEKKAEPLRLK